MRTFLILAAIVFVPFVWFIVRMLRFTDDTVGENSPIYRERTYQISFGQYFGTFTKGLLVVLFALMLVLSYMLFSEAIRQQDLRILIFIPIFLAGAGIPVFFFYVDWQYWIITRNVVLTLNPSAPGIRVDEPVLSITLTPESVARIERHEKDSVSSKDLFALYGYYLFFCTNGRIVRVNRQFLLFNEEFLERYFRNIPQTIVRHRVPWIVPIAQAVAADSPASIS